MLGKRHLYFGYSACYHKRIKSPTSPVKARAYYPFCLFMLVWSIWTYVVAIFGIIVAYLLVSNYGTYTEGIPIWLQLVMGILYLAIFKFSLLIARIPILYRVNGSKLTTITFIGVRHIQLDTLECAITHPLYLSRAPFTPNSYILEIIDRRRKRTFLNLAVVPRRQRFVLIDSLWPYIKKKSVKRDLNYIFTIAVWNEPRKLMQK
jgi:hypothetical protein